MFCLPRRGDCQKKKASSNAMAKTETCLNVVDALCERMKSTHITRVKVTDLCRDAGIARATFYEYFQDIYDVALWMWDHLTDTNLYQAGVTLSCYEAHLRKFQALRGYVDFFNNAFRTVEYASIVQHGGRRAQEHYEAVFQHKTGRPMSEEEQLQVEFFVTGAKHMTRHWAERQMAEPPEVMAQIFTTAMPAFMIPLLEPENEPASE